MDRKTSDKSFRAGLCNSVEQAEKVPHRLFAAGFTRDEVAVICPEPLKNEIAADLQHAKRPGGNAAPSVLTGTALGALGGVALAAAAVATGGPALLPAIPVLIGGGAFAGSFSSLIAADGYGKGLGEWYQQALHEGKIIVGVETDETNADSRLALVEKILREEGAELVRP